ncbi:Ribosomal protein S18 [Neofusicoccum parvum]|nr:Ribosomal protein S18 [Neofusicoccum parvum]
MSLLRLAPRRPMSAICSAPARAFSTTCARNREGDATRDLLNTVISSTDRQNARLGRREAESRPAQSQFQTPSAGGTGTPTSNIGYASGLVAPIAREQSISDEMDSARLRAELENQAPRRWQYGEVYAPHDLTGVEAKKWRKMRRTPTLDAFDTLALNPLKEYKNFSIMSEYMTELGRIKHSKVTGLRPQNHRKLAKAIRRAIGIGIMPSVHIHPELIKTSHGAPQGGGY